MYKENKGVTLISVMIVVIVMLMLIGIGLSTGTDLIRDTKLKAGATTMLLISAKVNSIAENYNFNQDNELLGTKLEVGSNDLNSFGVISKGAEQDDMWYMWRYDELYSCGIETNLVEQGKEDTCFIVNYYSGEVIYSLGFEYLNQYKRLYSLSEIEKVMGK